MNRREFIGMGGAAFAIAATGRAWGADAPSNRLRLAIMGCNETGRLLNAQAEVRKLWSREYEKGWGPQG